MLDALAAAGAPAPDCPRTLDLLGRAVHVDVSPLLDEHDLEEIELALTKVARGCSRDGAGRRRRRRARRAGDAPPLPRRDAATASRSRRSPSRAATVREALGARYGIAGLHADYRALLDAGGLDAVVVCSPAGTHAEVVLAALDAGLHVFVEKPMCITLADADAIVAARDRAGRVVQVGTMKRFDPAYERLLAELPDRPPSLRYISVVVNDPEFEPFFAPGEIVRGNDVPADVIEATRRGESEQVEAAVGSGAPDVVRAFSESFLGSMIHDLNVVHGALERMGEPLPARSSAAPGGTRAVRSPARSGWRTARAGTPPGSSCSTCYEYRESIALLLRRLACARSRSRRRG